MKKCVEDLIEKYGTEDVFEFLAKLFGGELVKHTEYTRGQYFIVVLEDESEVVKFGEAIEAPNSALVYGGDGGIVKVASRETADVILTTKSMLEDYCVDELLEFIENSGFDVREQGGVWIASSKRTFNKQEMTYGSLLMLAKQIRHLFMFGDTSVAKQWGEKYECCAPVENIFADVEEWGVERCIEWLKNNTQNLSVSFKNGFLSEFKVDGDLDTGWKTESGLVCRLKEFVHYTAKKKGVACPIGDSCKICRIRKFDSMKTEEVIKEIEVMKYSVEFKEGEWKATYDGHTVKADTLVRLAKNVVRDYRAV